MWWRAEGGGPHGRTSARAAALLSARAGLRVQPLSVYFAYAADGRLIGVHYEVRNTFGERHSYVEPVEPGQLSEAGLRQQADKLFYVSPSCHGTALPFSRSTSGGPRISRCASTRPMLAAHSRRHLSRQGGAHQRRLLSQAGFWHALDDAEGCCGNPLGSVAPVGEGCHIGFEAGTTSPASHGGQFLAVSTETTRKAHHAG